MRGRGRSVPLIVEINADLVRQSIGHRRSIPSGMMSAWSRRAASRVESSSSHWTRHAMWRIATAWHVLIA